MRRQVTIGSHEAWPLQRPGRSMVKPNFLIIGAMKCGTTSLYELLQQHPQIGMSSIKEPQFFSHDEVFERGWEWYASLFEQVKDCKAIGDATTWNSVRSVWPNAAPRINQHLPDAKIIYSVRHPLERIESSWIESRKHRSGIVPFNRTVHERPAYLDASRYWFQISAYRDHRPDDQILVIFFEDFKADPQATLRRCFEFLDVDPDVPIEQTRQQHNRSQGAVVDGEILSWLRRYRGFGVLTGMAPKPIRLFLRDRLRGPSRSRPKWNPDTLAWAIDQIADDLHTFLRFYGKPQDFYDLENYAA